MRLGEKIGDRPGELRDRELTGILTSHFREDELHEADGAECLGELV